MNKTYPLLAFILILLGLGMFVIEANDPGNERPPGKILTSLNENTRYVSVDELAHRIIEGDPSVQLIDVRPAADFKNFSLPGATHISLADLLSEESAEILTTPGKDFIFYSNGDVEANKAWMIAYRSGFSRLYVLDDGLNHWVNTIIKPSPPADTEPQEAFNQYRFRVGASIYFTGGSANVAKEVPTEEIQFERKKKKNVVEGGC
jgi:sulfur-carrier protein adenylyltransferase/sulfurtransferase